MQQECHISHFYSHLTCLPLFPGGPVGPLFPEIPGSPFGPISPCTTNHINSTLNLVQFGKFCRGKFRNSFLFCCVSHFLSKHSWEAHSTLQIKNDKQFSEYIHFSTLIHKSPLINFAHLVAFHSTLTTITSRALTEQITTCHIT